MASRMPAKERPTLSRSSKSRASLRNLAISASICCTLAFTSASASRPCSAARRPPSRGRISCCFAWSSRRARVSAFCAWSSTACACSSVRPSAAGSAPCSSAPAPRSMSTAPSASRTFARTTSARLACRRFAASAWKALTRSRPSLTRFRRRSNSRRAASPALCVKRPASTVRRARCWRASARDACAAVAARSMLASTSLASSGGMLSSPMRKGASVSRIPFSTASAAATRSWACRTSGAAEARELASSIAFCALSSNVWEASARACSSSILLRLAPLRLAMRPEMRRNVGAKLARAARNASLASRASTSLASSGLVSMVLTSGSAMAATRSQSTSTMASREVSSPKSFSACNAIS
mmetsp:Transcript_31905/g.87847  ORF Transcript_31905/g.87847 Transcript_31905/m.87847 type:complete len:356 (-) Transcript_31905:591-1658(-)